MSILEACACNQLQITLQMSCCCLLMLLALPAVCIVHSAGMVAARTSCGLPWAAARVCQLTRSVATHRGGEMGGPEKDLAPIEASTSRRC